MRQLVAPDPNVTDGTGWCLRFAQSVFGAAARYPSAWESWLNGAAHKHRDRNFPAGSAVPLWFSHWGTYGGVYSNWGHVVVRFPDGRYLSSPAYGHGRLWLNSIEEVERTFNCTYVGWSEDINGLRVFDTNSTAQNKIPSAGISAAPTRNEDTMKIIANNATDLWVLAGPGVWWPIPSDKAGEFEAVYGARAAVSPETFASIQAACRSARAPELKVFANTKTDLWAVGGPGFWYPIPAGQGPIWEADYGTRIPVSDAEFERRRTAFLAGANA